MPIRSSRVGVNVSRNSGTRSVFNFVVALVGLVFSMLTCWQFARHLPSHDHNFFATVEALAISKTPEPVLWNLLQDGLLILMFAIQHTGMVPYSASLDFGVPQRTLYVILTSIALQLVMTYWKPVVSVSLWSVNTRVSIWSWWAFTLTHWLCWVTLYGAALLMDMLELFGLKQVYYEMQGWPHPLDRKSPELQRLYRHMRHPGFTAFILVLWCHPIMCLDRLLLGLLLPIYIMLAYRVDCKDHQLIMEQFQMKSYELKQLS